MYDLNTIRQMNERLAQGAASLVTKTPEPTDEAQADYDEYLDQQFWGDH